MPAVVVQVYDADLFEHDHVGTVRTDEEGRFRLTLDPRTWQKPSVIGELSGGPDLFFRVLTEAGTELLREPPSAGRRQGRQDVGRRTEVELVVDVPGRKGEVIGGPKGKQRLFRALLARWGVEDEAGVHRAVAAAEPVRHAMRQPPEDLDPGAPEGNAAELVDSKAKVSATPNPDPLPPAYGLARFFKVEGLGSPGLLRFRVEPSETRELDPASLRLFRWDERRGRFQIVQRSGLGRDGSYVWARVRRDGVYGAYGLPRAAAVRLKLQLAVHADAFAPLYAAGGVGRAELTARLAAALLPDGLRASGLLDQPHALHELGLADTIGDLRLWLGRPLGRFPVDAKGKVMGPPEGYPSAWFGAPSRLMSGGFGGGFGGGGLPGGGFPGDGELPGEGFPGDGLPGDGLPGDDFGGGGDDLPGGRVPGEPGSVRGWEPGDPICPDDWRFRFPPLQIEDWWRIRWPGGFPGGVGGGTPRTPSGCTCSTWESAGPTNVGGRMRAIVWHPTNANVVYAGAAGGGVWRSTDTGQTWAPLMQGALSLSIGAIAIAPSNPQVIYAATGEYATSWYNVGSTYPGQGVYRTTNGGGDWDRIPGVPSTRCSRLLVHPTNPDRVYVSGTGGVHRWNAATQVWDKVLAVETSDMVMDPTDPARVYAGVENTDGIVVTDDIQANPVVWRPFNAGITFPSHWPNPRRTALAIARSNASVLYASVNTEVVDADGNWQLASAHVYRWNGTTWRDLGSHGSGTYGYWCNAIAVHPTDPNQVIVGGVWLERSDDGGETWSGRGGVHADQHAIAFSPHAPALTLVGNDGGIYRHRPSDGTDYQASMTGLVTGQAYNCAVSTVAPFALGGSTQDQGVVKTDTGATFVGMGGNEGGIFEIDPNDSRIVYWDPWDGNLRRTTNGTGAAARVCVNGLGTDPDGNVHSISTLAVCPGDSNRVLCANDANNVYLTTDGAADAPGTGWTRIVANSGSAVRRFAFAPSLADRVYFVTEGGRVWRSNDRGASFAAVSDGTLTGRAIAGLTVDSADEDIVYVTLSGVGTGFGRVWRSDDGGVHWNDVSGGLLGVRLPDVPFTAIVQHWGDPEKLYVASELGVYRTIDGGDSWEPFDDGLPNAAVTDMDVCRHREEIYVSTIGRGFWRRGI